MNIDLKELQNACDKLAEKFVDVKTAKLEKGMLNVHLVREVPEELKPKTIDIVEAE